MSRHRDFLDALAERYMLRPMRTRCGDMTLRWVRVGDAIFRRTVNHNGYEAFLYLVVTSTNEIGLKGHIYFYGRIVCTTSSIADPKAFVEETELVRQNLQEHIEECMRFQAVQYEIDRIGVREDAVFWDTEDNIQFVPAPLPWRQVEVE